MNKREIANKQRDSANPPLSVVLIDGECHLCQNITKFVVKHDRSKTFSFATLQSIRGQALLKQAGLPPNDWDSFVLYDNGVFHTHSGAALRVMKGLGGWRSLAYLLIAVPRPIRDRVYRWVANNRHRWFRGEDSCLMPTPDVLSRFIEDGYKPQSHM